MQYPPKNVRPLQNSATSPSTRPVVAAPPVYRPLARLPQTTGGPSQGAVLLKQYSAGAAPPVYRPQPLSTLSKTPTLTAPPVYQPAPSREVLQARMARMGGSADISNPPQQRSTPQSGMMGRSLGTPGPAPPVYHPLQPGQPLQAAQVGRSNTLAAPPVYRPQQSPQPLQSRMTMPVAPPVYRPAQASSLSALQLMKGNPEKKAKQKKEAEERERRKQSRKDREIGNLIAYSGDMVKDKKKGKSIIKGMQEGEYELKGHASQSSGSGMNSGTKKGLEEIITKENLKIENEKNIKLDESEEEENESGETKAKKKAKWIKDQVTNKEMNEKEALEAYLLFLYELLENNKLTDKQYDEMAELL